MLLGQSLLSPGCGTTAAVSFWSFGKSRLAAQTCGPGTALQVKSPPLRRRGRALACGGAGPGGSAAALAPSQAVLPWSEELVSPQEKPLVFESAWKKEKDVVAKEMEKLRASIQTLCRSALPLGKVMDYLQEDVDAMQRELQLWRGERQQHAEALRAEQRSVRRRPGARACSGGTPRSSPVLSKSQNFITFMVLKVF